MLGHPSVPFTDLMYLYARLKPGKTIHAWMEENPVLERGIDAQRFVSFGVIKGFLRRVHRWPVLLPRDKAIKKIKTTTLGDASSVSLSASSTATITHHMEMTKPASAPHSDAPFSNPYQAQPTVSTNMRPKPSQRPSATRTTSNDPTVEALIPLLDGSRHSDELCVKFGIGWHDLERLLIVIGQGDEPEYLSGHTQLRQDGSVPDRWGRVRVIYR